MQKPEKLRDNWSDNTRQELKEIGIDMWPNLSATRTNLAEDRSA